MYNLTHSDEPSLRQYRIVRISMEVLTELLSLDGTRVIKIQGLPKDAKLVNLQVDAYYSCIDLVYESSSWSPIQEGCCIPRIELEFSSRTLVPGLVCL